MHPLEQRFMERMMGQPVTPLKPAGAVPPSQPMAQQVTPVPKMPPMKPSHSAPPPGLTPPSAFPTFATSGAKPMKLPAQPAQKPAKPVAEPEEEGMPMLDFALPIDAEEAKPAPMPLAAAKPAAAKKQPAAAPLESMDLGFDIGKAEDELSPEKKKEIEFESIMERFKNVVTTQQKMLAYEFADQIGVTERIEEFYEFLSHPDKDGIISYKGDQVKINKTKIMGALMLGDNSILDRVMMNFRAWLVKAMK
jgi:hypothetical protein